MTSSVYNKKLRRLAANEKPRVLDLFAGCGGFSLGFHAAGFRLAGAIENDPDAAASYGRNFHPGQAAHARPRDVTKVTPDELAAELGLGKTDEAIDVIIGGPPCQAFARVGRPKLREIDKHPEAFRHDPRASLYLHYLRYVDAFKPLAIVMENVPDVLNHAGQNIAEDVADCLASKGYVCRYTLLNAAHFGVPQTRERMFLVGLRRERERIVTFPAPTHWIDPPAGYANTRAVALKGLRGSSFFEPPSAYVPPHASTPDLPAAITAQEALQDLPAIDARALLAAGRLRLGARRFDSPVPYPPARKLSPYARQMRSWPGFEAGDAITDHVIRYLPRDYEIFARMKPGDQYPEAHAIALAMFQERLREAGIGVGAQTQKRIAIKRATVPPYDVGKFPNKWRKICPDQPARTLMAHLSKDSYSHIHYDGAQARTISVREAARLQSFPDGFTFAGTMNPAFRQIGNAVPPLLAKTLALEIAATLKATSARAQSPLSAAGPARSRLRSKKEAEPAKTRSHVAAHAR